MSNLRSANEILAEEWTKIQYVWQNTSSQWNDAAKLRFERDYWQAYAPVIHDAMKELERLDSVIDQVKREVK